MFGLLLEFLLFGRFTSESQALLAQETGKFFSSGSLLKCLPKHGKDIGEFARPVPEDQWARQGSKGAGR